MIDRIQLTFRVNISLMVDIRSTQRKQKRLRAARATELQARRSKNGHGLLSNGLVIHLQETETPVLPRAALVFLCGDIQLLDTPHLALEALEKLLPALVAGDVAYVHLVLLLA